MNLLQIYLTGFNSFCMIVAIERLQCQVANNHITINNCIYVIIFHLCVYLSIIIIELI